MRVVALAVRQPALSDARIGFILTLTLAFLLLAAAPGFATSVIPTTDQALYAGSDVVVHGVVQSTEVREGLDGTPETVTVIEPIEVLKGGLPGTLVLRQSGGTLPDGRFFKLWGRADYEPGREVIVFAISRADGDYQTSEMLLGKFEVWKDAKQRSVAVAELSRGHHQGVNVVQRKPRSNRGAQADGLNSLDGPRDLGKFLAFLRLGARSGDVSANVSFAELTPVEHPVERRITPSWAPISGLWRYNNGASSGWTLNGTANITGGGTAEAQRALATWTNEPNSTISHVIGGSNTIHLNALSSPCGWTTALPASLGVVGCGGPRGSGSHTWRSETYGTITGGEVWLRAYSSTNQLSSVVTESILLHELGHALGLGHSDQAASQHDTCRGDESAAIMRSSVQSRTTLGTDDVDAVRWLYGDGGKSCTPAPSGSQKTPADFNGDGVSESVIYRAGAWLWPATGAGVWTGQPSANCIPAPGDFDGDGRTEMALFCSGAWHFYRANGTYLKGIWTGGSGDIPVPADYNGDGRDDVVVYRRGAWIAFDYATGASSWSVWTGPSTASAIPLPMDHNGDGRADLSVYVGGAWHFFNANGSYLKGIWTGASSANTPVPGDYDGNGTEEVVVFRTGAWLFFDFNTGANVRGVWTGGQPHNGAPVQPAPLDYDGDGSVDFSVFTGGPWHFFNDNGSYRNGVWVGAVAADRAISRRLRTTP